MTFGSRLKERREALNITQADLSKKLGISKSAIANYETGVSSPKEEILLKLFDALEVDANYLFQDSFEKEPDTVELTENEKRLINAYRGSIKKGIIAKTPNTKRLPLLGKIACGQPIIADEERGEYVDCDEDVEADFALIASGDSMIGARILDGDVVYIHRQDTVNNGEIAAVMLIDAETGDAEATLKRVFWDGKKLILSAENSKYPPMVFTGDELEGAQILGKAVAFRSKVR